MLGLGERGLARAQPAALQSLRYIAIGGGATPESTEVSLEQNLALAAEVFGTSRGALYFAGGEGSRSVRVEDGTGSSDPLLVELGDLFNPRAGRHGRYRVTSLPARAASLAEVESGVLAALRAGGEPLLLYVSAHGEQGDAPPQNAVALWGGDALRVTDLARWHDAHPRPLRMLAASCFSGGFGDLAFRAADTALGATAAPRCGLFAGTWDRETSGCDPDPDRRNQEGYSLHVLQALRGRDRDGKPLPSTELDLDRDGRISLLEAHVRASIAARSIDVPTTTSERYLRSVQRKRAATDRALAPEYAAVIDALSPRLGLRSEREVGARLAALERQLRELAVQMDDADADLQARYAVLAGRLLARWPELDDAYHPQFAPTLTRDRAAIADALGRWPEALAYRDAQHEVERLAQGSQLLEVEEAQVARLQRAYETLGLVSALRRRGGAMWTAYQRLLSCERYVPPR